MRTGLQVTWRVERIRFYKEPPPQSQRGYMASRAANICKQERAGFGGAPLPAVLWDYTAWSSKLRLKDRDRRDVAHAQFIDNAIAVRVQYCWKQEREAFRGLHPVVMIHCVVRKFPQRNDGAFLVEWPDNQIFVHTANLARFVGAARRSSQWTQV